MATESLGARIVAVRAEMAERTSAINTLAGVSEDRPHGFNEHTDEEQYTKLIRGASKAVETMANNFVSLVGAPQSSVLTIVKTHERPLLNRIHRNGSEDQTEKQIHIEKYGLLAVRAAFYTGNIAASRRTLYDADLKVLENDRSSLYPRELMTVVRLDHRKAADLTLTGHAVSIATLLHDTDQQNKDLQAICIAAGVESTAVVIS